MLRMRRRCVRPRLYNDAMGHAYGFDVISPVANDELLVYRAAQHNRPPARPRPTLTPEALRVYRSRVPWTMVVGRGWHRPREVCVRTVAR